jgi:hypothetical protein
MVSPGLLRRVALIRTDSEKLSTSIIRLTRIVVPISQILVTLMMEVLYIYMNRLTNNDY